MNRKFITQLENSRECFIVWHFYWCAWNWDDKRRRRGSRLRSRMNDSCVELAWIFIKSSYYFSAIMNGIACPFLECWLSENGLFQRSENESIQLIASSYAIQFFTRTTLNSTMLPWPSARKRNAFSFFPENELSWFSGMALTKLYTKMQKL